MENNDGCNDQYICDTELYLLYMFSHAQNIIIGNGVGSLGHGKEFLGCVNAT